MIRSTFKQTKLIFKLPGERIFNETTKKFEEGASKLVRASGILQPYVPRPREQVGVPEGFQLSDSKVYQTDANLPELDQTCNKMGAVTTIGCRDYYVCKKLDFSDMGMSTDHIFYILAMKRV